MNNKSFVICQECCEIMNIKTTFEMEEFMRIHSVSTGHCEYTFTGRATFKLQEYLHDQIEGE